MENTDAHLAYLDFDFNFVAVNSAYVAGSGYRQEELIGKNHFELFAHDENELIFRRVRNTGIPAQFKAKPFRFPGQPWRGVTYWDWRLTPVRGADGAVQGVVLSLIDVTRTTKAQLASDALNRIDDLIHSTLVLETVLDQVMSELAATVGCEAVTVAFRSTDARWRVAGVLGLPGSVKDREFGDEDFPAATEALHNGVPVHVADGDSPRFPGRMAESLGIKAMMLAPLVLPEHPFGVLCFGYTSGPAVFDDAQIDFARKAAASLSLGIGNTQLYEAEKAARMSAARALDRTELLLRAARSLNATDGLHRVLEELASVTMAATGRSRVMVSLNDADKNELVIEAATPGALPTGTRIPVSGLSERMQGVLTMHRPTAVDYSSSDLSTGERESAASFNTRMVLVIPLIVGDRFIGHLFVDEPRGERPFDEDDIEIAAALASHAAVVVENARLYEDQLRREVR